MQSNPVHTAHSFQPTTPSGTTSLPPPTFHPNSLVSTRIPGGYSIGFRLPWSVLVGEGCGRRLGDLRSDFKLYLGMDRSIYLGGVSAIMHGLTVSVAAKLTLLRRAAVHFSLFLFMSPFFDRVTNRKRRGGGEEFKI